MPYKQSKIPTKWTLFIKKHWLPENLVKELIPSYFFRELKSTNWQMDIQHLKAPGSFSQLIQFCDTYGEKNKWDEKSLEHWYLIRDIFLYQSSLLSLLPQHFSEFLIREYRLDFVKAYLQSIVDKKLYAMDYPEEIKSKNLLIISILQLTAANHSLSFLLLYRYIHNSFLMELMRSTKNQRFAEKYQLEPNAKSFEALFEAPYHQGLPYEDLLQAVRLLDLCYLISSINTRANKIIAKPAEL